MFTPKKNSSNKNIDDLSVVAEFLIEDFRFTRSYLSIMDKLFLEERKRYESAYNFHANKVEELANKYNLKIAVYKNGDLYDDGYPIVPLNADEFEKDDVLFIEQMIEPIILTVDGKVIRQGTAILGRKENN